MKIVGPKVSARWWARPRTTLFAAALSVALVCSVPAAAFAVPRGIHSFTTAVSDESEDAYTQAGGHPFSANATFVLNLVAQEKTGALYVAGDAKDVEVELPPGFIGNPQVAQKCPSAFFQEGSGSILPKCPAGSVVGFVRPQIASAPSDWDGSSFGATVSPLYELVSQPGYPAQFGYVNSSQPFVLSAKVRSDGDYGLTVSSPSTPSRPTPLAASVTFCSYGVTYDETHGAFPSFASCRPRVIGAVPLLRNPTRCASPAPVTTMRADTYEEPGNYASITSYAGAPSAPPAFAGGPTSEASPVGSPGVPGGSYVTGCEALTEAWVGKGAHPGEPSFTFRPEVTQADTPSGYSVDLHVPQGGLGDADGLASADLDGTTVTLPAGVALSPSAANGLQACSEGQIGVRSESPLHFDLEEPRCPDASKVGTLEVDTPLLEDPLAGSIYLAEQGANPFHSRFAIYLAVDDEKTGVVIKLAGRVTPDPVTGQITTTFEDSPQLPFEDFRLNFFGGSRASLVNPSTCGGYATQTQLTPWSAVDPEAPTAAETATPGDRFVVDSGPGGGGCANAPQDRPFAPAMNAGTEGIAAGAHSPFVLRLTRSDGEQEFGSLDTTLPPGLTATLAGVPYCADASIAAASGRTGAAEQASPSCPAASQIGTVTTGAGAGPDPYYVAGRAYLAGPYKGAPLSVAFITPAVAGPFDLGNVVVRAAAEVDPTTAQITVKTDAIPTILEGVPLRVRSIVARIDRPDFTLNPTSCEPMSVTARVAGSSGATATPANRFQVGDCGALPFKPNLKIRLKGATARVGHPALKAVLTAKPGEAGIGRAQVNLPHGEFLDQGNLNKTCTKPVLLAGNCPRSTIYGRAKAWTPLLEKPLEGNVYLVGGYGYKLPALVADLDGQIRVTLVGKVDSGPNKGIRNTFELVPDAPVSRFVLEMKGGRRYGLLENSEDLCRASKAKRRAIVRFTGQNGKVRQFKPAVANDCKKKGKKGGKGKKSKKAR